ncbi:flagellar biosynthesis anti-sigma factor FlgM [Bacillaceae bacterium Marseille-Q3522]|nr:flagellar biosynthesis anti-sigma factor FlgM [Bacillaceae bacterium Marseille-Q3522]
MKINQIGSSGINPYQRQLNKQENINKKAIQSEDKIEISHTAKEMQLGSTYAAQRQEKINALKMQVENSTYKINPQQLAKAIANYYKV